MGFGVGVGFGVDPEVGVGSSVGSGLGVGSGVCPDGGLLAAGWKARMLKRVIELRGEPSMSVAGEALGKALPTAGGVLFGWCRVPNRCKPLFSKP